MTIKPDILDIISGSRSFRFDTLGAKPNCKKYHDFSVLRNHIKLYIKEYGDVYKIYRIDMEDSLNSYNKAERLVNSPKKAAELQESIEKHHKSGMLQEIIRLNTLL